MTIFDILKLAAGFSAEELTAFLNSIAQKFPDLAPAAMKLLADLAAAAAPANLVALAEALPKELASIGQGRLDPRDHPSDSI